MLTLYYKMNDGTTVEKIPMAFVWHPKSPTAHVVAVFSIVCDGCGSPTAHHDILDSLHVCHLLVDFFGIDANTTGLLWLLIVSMFHCCSYITYKAI